MRLVEIRTSQLNGCAYCLDMHTKEARAAGESEQRLYQLTAWKESPGYSNRERTALEWTEDLTLIADEHVPDAVFAAVRPHFTQEELVQLTLTVVAINSWNRLGISLRMKTGTYQPKQARAS